MSFSSEPDFKFIEQNIIPLFGNNGDWLSLLLLHLEEMNFCPDLFCSTCGAGPFKKVLRTVWRSSEQPHLKAVWQEINDGPHISNDELEKIIQGLHQIEYLRIPGKPKSFVGDQFPDNFLGNRLRQLIYYVWKQTLMKNKSASDYEYLSRRWEGTLIGDEFVKMQKHYAIKQRKLALEMQRQGSPKVRKSRKMRPVRADMAQKSLKKSAIQHILEEQRIDQAEKAFLVNNDNLVLQSKQLGKIGSNYEPPDGFAGVYVKKETQRVKNLYRPLETVIFKYSTGRIDFNEAALEICRITCLDNEPVRDVLRSVEVKKDDNASEQDLFASWQFDLETDSFEIQDFRNKWIKIFHWMTKYKKGEATKIQVGNATNWLFYGHTSFSLDTLDKISVQK